MEWNNIEDGFPEMGTEVQVYFYHEGYDENIVTTAYFESDGTFNNTDRIDDFYSEDVTHWAPLNDAPNV